MKLKFKIFEKIKTFRFPRIKFPKIRLPRIPKLFQYPDNLKVIKDTKGNFYNILYFPPYSKQKYYVGLDYKLYQVLNSLQMLVKIKDEKDVADILAHWRRKIFFRYIKNFLREYFFRFVFYCICCKFVYICLDFDFNNKLFKILGTIIFSVLSYKKFF